MADFHSSHLRQSGLAGVHLIGALLAIMLLSWLVLDVLTLYSLRVRLQHALLHAARQASVHHASPETIALAFNQTLAAARVPLHDQWQIQILSPSAEAFRLHGRPSKQHGGLTGITQGWQAQQHEQTGPVHPSIYQANTLHLYLLYAHRPGPLSLIHLLPRLAASTPNPLGYAAVWLRLEIKHPMQSDAVQWEDLPDGRVIYVERASSKTDLPVSQTDWPAGSAFMEVPALDGDSSPAPGDSPGQGVNEGPPPPNPGTTTPNPGEESVPDAPNPACY